MKKQIKKSVKIFIFILFLSIFLVQTSDNSLAISKWNYYGGTSRASFIQSTGNAYVDDVTRSSLYDTVYSVYSPLIDDLDGNGFNEIIVITNSNEIKLFNGTDFDLLDTYYNAELTPSGQFVTIDFLGDSNPELMIITNTVASNYSLWVVNWNGSDFNITKEIELPSDEASNGLSCYSGECYYFSDTGKLYKYNQSDDTNTSPVYDSGSNDTCFERSIPIFYDYDLDDDMDIFTIWNANCYHVLQLENNGSSFTLDYNYTFDTTASAISNIGIANLDGGQKELVITQSHLFRNPTTPFFSYVYYYGLNDHSLICSQSFHDGSTKVPLITSLHTCYLDEGQGACDYDDDGWDEVWITLHWSEGVWGYAANGTFEVLDEGCNILASIEMIGNDFPIDEQHDYNTEDYIKGVYANMDSDEDFEYIFLYGIWNKDGSLLKEILSPSFYPDEYSIKQTDYILVADVTGNNLNDIIIQDVDIANISKISVYSFDYASQNPYFIGDGVDVDTCVPLCINETITFYARQGLDYEDNESDFAVLGVDCYELGLSNLTWGSLAEDPEVSCTYNVLGSWEVDIYITDEYNYPSYSESETMGIYTSLSSSCYSAGEWEEECSPFVYDPPEPVERCFTDSAISVCLVTGTSVFLCEFCECDTLPQTLCPSYYNGTIIDGYNDRLFDWNQCESWEGSVWYGACPFYIWIVSGLNSIWDFIFGAFWIFLTLLLVIIILAIVVKKRIL